ncbi:SNF-related serine/threonine-protein kinase [Drosophila subobscura]|uniref:SNF-related serine/threonine-protein kinase n=1 Tax=Drosophila subobscura TaxID=7241 RepID=UPI00155AF75F|nr:SNF-related serine/threonine-protein kinase [Drosophila subobscura]XP_034651611.1 SNF-related serine/threonine-protein kinase [Drosophila subobscura]
MTLETQPVGGLGDGKIAGLYDLEETLGSGHFAVVKLARHVFTGAKVAVKVVDKTKLDEVSKTHLFQEVRCMKLVQHPNVVRLYEVIDTQTKLYLVLELGDGGDLYDYIMKHEAGLSEELARKYFRQILRAITYCHQLHVVHRDLKPENVVFFEKLGLVKLTDFGFSNKFSPGQKLETFCGSLAYSAPEILLGDSYDAPAVDIWSLGVILYMLVVGQAPFEKANDSETLTMIMDCKYTVPAHVSAECRTLIASMLVRDPKKRATVEELASSDWLKPIDEPDSTSTEHFLPLVSREQLSGEDHDFIIQKMINGNIASEEEIVQALDKNKYNHITATYFLVAEILLRRRREEQAQKQKAGDASRKPVAEKPSPTEAPKLVPISINVTPAAQLANDGGKPDKRSRKCSIVREEDEEESASEGSVVGNELKVTTSRLESTSEGQVNRAVQERTSNVLPTAPAAVGVPRNSRTKIVVSVDATLAQKLKQMEKSAKIDEDTLRGLKELEIGKLKPLPSSSKNPVLSHRRTKLNKGTPSCSSSEASDDDTKTRNKKKINKFVGDTPTRFRMHRRDSHDDSSDSQDQLYPPPGSASGAANFISKSSGVSGKKEGQGQCKEPNKSEETRKSHTQQKNRKQPKDHVDKHSQAEKQQSVVTEGSTGTSSTRRRRMRESQSLDRITEAQEYELRHRSYADGEAASSSTQHIDQRYSQSILITNTFSVAETKEEYDEDEEPETKPRTVAAADPHDAKDQIMNTLNAAKATLQQEQYFNNNTNLSRNFNNNNNKNNSQSNSKSNKKKSNETPKDIYNLNSIEEIDLILEDKSLTKAIHVTGSKCFVTMKKIRRLGKYFPVVNFS